MRINIPVRPAKSLKPSTFIESGEVLVIGNGSFLLPKNSQINDLIVELIPVGISDPNDFVKATKTAEGFNITYTAIGEKKLCWYLVPAKN